MIGTIKLRCPNLRCRAILSVSVEMRGTCVRCEECGEDLLVPAERKETKPGVRSETNVGAG